MRDDISMIRSKRSYEAANLLYENEFYDECVSRCYYSMFYLVQGLFMERGLQYSTHSGLISQFGKHFVKDGPLDKEYSKILNKGFERRMLGDYGQVNTTSKETASKALDEANIFNRKIRELLED